MILKHTVMSQKVLFFFFFFYILWFPDLLFPVKSSTNREHLGLGSSSWELRCQLLFVFLCIYLWSYSRSKRIKTLTPVVGALGRALGNRAAGSFPNTASYLSRHLYGCSTPCKTDMFPYLMSRSNTSSRAGTPPTPMALYSAWDSMALLQCKH